MPRQRKPSSNKQKSANKRNAFKVGLARKAVKGLERKRTKDGVPRGS